MGKWANQQDTKIAVVEAGDYMRIQKVVSQLSKYEKECLFFSPLADGEFAKKTTEIGISLPEELLELLHCFDGGELFIPGTTIYGLASHPHVHSIQQANAELKQLRYSIPSNYYVFGKLNFGDFLCVNLEPGHDVIEWDHENNERYCSWGSISEWLQETITVYTNEISGENNAKA